MVHVRSFTKAETACGLTKITQEELKLMLTGDRDISDIEKIRTIDCPKCFELYAPCVEKLRRYDPERLERLQRSIL